MNLENSSSPVLIVGAGMAGLSAAIYLTEKNIPVRIIEASEGVGGRVRTDCVDGFLLDRGFQVFLDAYPETGCLLDMDLLDLRKFEPGALVFRGGRLHRLMDVFRRPGSLFSSATAPIGSISDKLRVGLLRRKMLRSSIAAIGERPDRSTEQYLRGFGFSEGMIDSFFRPFYGGIFLERELRTSSRMFEFTFKMFGKGSATLPAKGMGEIPRQLAARLSEGTIRLNSEVARVEERLVVLSDGEEIKGSGVILATDITAAENLNPSLKGRAPQWRAATNLYYSADTSPIKEPIICLNGSGSGLVNSVCTLTDLSSKYAPSGKVLISVAILGDPPMEGLADSVKIELASWFGEEVGLWEHLRTDRIERALPEQLPESQIPSSAKGFMEVEGVYVCGDHAVSASIEGAVISGKRAAEAIFDRLTREEKTVV